MAAAAVRSGAAREPWATQMTGQVTVQPLQTPHLSHHCRAPIVTLLVCVSAWSMVTAARTQIVTSGLEAPPFAPGDSPREPVQQLDDESKCQRPPVFESQAGDVLIQLMP